MSQGGKWQQLFPKMLDPVRLHRSLQTQLKTEFCGHHLIQWSVIDSTNRVLMDWLRTGSLALPEGITVVAARQSGGRGQHNRRWHSSSGGLYLSVLLTPRQDLNRLSQLTVALGWGIASQLKQFCTQAYGAEIAEGIGVKWPNDLVIQGHKLAGILTQARWQGSQLQGVVAGVGVNVNNAPPEGMSLAQMTGVALDLTSVAAHVLSGIERGYLTWQRKGLDPILPDYNSWLWHRGCTLEPSAGDQSVPKGTVIGVANSADLRIQTHTGEQWVHPGQVSLGYATSDPLQALTPLDLP